MRISDWSSDVCSSDLGEVKKRARFPGPSPHETGRPDEQQAAINVPSHWAYMKTLNYPAFFRDRTSVVSGKSVSVRVDLGGRRHITKKHIVTAYNLDNE